MMKFSHCPGRAGMIFFRSSKLLVFFCLFPIFLLGCTRMQTVFLRVGDVVMQVEVADSPEERQVGLMNRRSLGDREGMLFVFETSGNRGFWMKDTGLPLSIAFISTEGFILQITDMSPYSTEIVSADQIYQYALEVLQGTFQQYGIEVGDKVIIPPLL